MRQTLFGLSLTLLFYPANAANAQQPPEKIPIIFDTDIGNDMDDPFALALILASPELDLRGVTTVSGKTQQRAMMLCRFLTMTGRRHTPVAVGAEPQPAREITSQYQYYYHPDVLFNRTTKPVKESAVDFIYARLKAQPGKITILATGPLTNIGRLIAEKPECKPWIKRIVVSGGTSSDKDGGPPIQRNLVADMKAAQTVLESGVPLVVVPQHIVKDAKLDPAQCRRVFRPGTALTNQVQCLYQLWDKENPPLADALAAAICFEERHVTMTQSRLELSDKGTLAGIKGGKANGYIVQGWDEAFLKWFVERMESCVAPADRPAKFVAQGGMPNRVHVAEDFDNDIERRWWMSGKAETKNLPPGSSRACRGVLTHDFDDLLGNPKAMYTAVVFNPVPGPPMGKNPRLSFKYWLKGTGTMRVQIYSLTNGYHRHLVLKDLPQEKWQAGTMDMTVARRPDGTSGPLAEGERIDDIQFYVDAKAELLIDDIVLYDAAMKGEKRPFPKQIFFSGLFDSGKQGKEWPGDFIIAPQKGFFWNAAQSVPNKDLGLPWIRLHLRGERAVGEKTEVSFRYRLSGGDSMRVALMNRTAKDRHVVELKNLAADRWADATVAFNNGTKGPRRADRVDEIHFLLAQGAELLLDDVLLYEPGQGVAP